jgi:hypothetical protein
VAAIPFFLAMWLGDLFAIIPQEAPAGVILYTLLNARAAGPPVWALTAAFFAYFTLGTH